MNKEIKEILDKLYLDFEKAGLTAPEYSDLRDYITNLQEENERLREVVENLTTMTVCGDRKQIKNTAQFKLEQCQSRIDKAIEYLLDKYVRGLLNDDEVNKVVKILKGEDKELKGE